MKKSALLILLCLSAPLYAAECPVNINVASYLDKVSAAIRATKSCDEGSTIAESCAMGSSGDTETAVVAERQCGLDFWKKLSKSDKKTYNDLQSKCDQKFKDKDGTMYMSANAFCRLNIAKLYSELYTPAE